MSNTVHNTLTIYGEPEHYWDFWRDCCGKKIKHVDDKDVYNKAFLKYSLYRGEFYEENGNYLCCYYDTSRHPYDEMIAKISEIYPKLVFETVFFDPACDVFGGFIYKNGYCLAACETTLWVPSRITKDLELRGDFELRKLLEDSKLEEPIHYSAYQDENSETVEEIMQRILAE